MARIFAALFLFNEKKIVVLEKKVKEKARGHFYRGTRYIVTVEKFDDEKIMIKK